MDELQVLETEVRSCTRCRLSETRKRAVPGEGDRQAKIMFVGEGPGFWENEQGRPFVGQAGKLLEDLLAGIGMRREQVYITNVIKCRPPNNRDPLPDELAACHGYLERQIALFEPKADRDARSLLDGQVLPARQAGARSPRNDRDVRAQHLSGDVSPRRGAPPAFLDAGVGRGLPEDSRAAGARRAGVRGGRGARASGAHQSARTAFALLMVGS